MRSLRRACALSLLVACLGAGSTLGAAAATSSVAGSCPLFPADNVWNTDISTLPVHPLSATWIGSSGGPSRLIHPDFGPSGTSVPYGIPWQLVDASHQKVSVSFQYASESDPGPYPLGPDTPIEGGASSSGDRHALVVDQSTCTLYETWATYYDPSGSHAGSGAHWDLRSDALRPAGWTSADAAGLPILPGLLRWSEVASGAVRHAIRFTVQQTDTAYIWPARHQAGAAADASLPPMGARFRLKRSVDLSGFSAAARTILTAMQHYGLILADNGSNWYFQGDTDPDWPDSVLTELKSIPAGDFEAVDESSLMLDPNSGAARQPATATPTPQHLTVKPPAATSAPAATAAAAGSPSPSPSADTSPLPSASPTAAPLADASQPADSGDAALPALPQSSAAHGGSGGGAPWIPMAVAAGAVLLAAVFVAAAVRHRGARARP